jgi:hypothetical protein
MLILCLLNPNESAPLAGIAVVVMAQAAIVSDGALKFSDAGSHVAVYL